MTFGTRVAFTLILSSSLFTICSAQPLRLLKNASLIELGTGPSLVSIYGKNIANKVRQPKIGYTVRVGALFRLKENWFISTNLLYERKGLKTKSLTEYYDQSKDSLNCNCTTSVGTFETNSNRDYLSLSVLSKLKLTNTNFFVGVGLFSSYLVKSGIRLKYSWDQSLNYSNNGLAPSQKRIDAGVSATIGYEIKIKDGSGLTISIMDNYGLISINKSSQQTARTNSLAFQLGINFLK